MAEKILMYVSTPARNAIEQEYTCPDNKKVTGMLTNEAPVKYLLNRYPDIEELICICSTEVIHSKFKWFVNPATGMKKKLEDGQTTEEPIYQQTSYEYLENVWSTYKPDIRIKPIEVSADDDFESVIVPELETMENLTENITLCRSDKIESSMNEFNMALENARDCSEPLISTLLPIFSAKFGKDGKMDIVELINWCLESNMYQQAITVYAEQIPKYILTTCENKYLIVNNLEQSKKNSRKLTNANEQSKFFNDTFLSMSLSASLAKGEKDSPYDKKTSIRRRKGTSKFVNTIQNFEELLEKNKDKYSVVCDMEQMKTILRDYVYIRLLRNMTNHASSENIKEKRADETYLKEYEYRDGCHYPDLNTTNLEQIHDVLKSALEHLKL